MCLVYLGFCLSERLLLYLEVFAGLFLGGALGASLCLRLGVQHDADHHKHGTHCGNRIGYGCLKQHKSCNSGSNAQNGEHDTGGARLGLAILGFNLGLSLRNRALRLLLRRLRFGKSRLSKVALSAVAPQGAGESFELGHPRVGIGGHCVLAALHVGYE